MNIRDIKCNEIVELFYLLNGQKWIKQLDNQGFAHNPKYTILAQPPKVDLKNQVHIYMWLILPNFYGVGKNKKNLSSLYLI